MNGKPEWDFSHTQDNICSSNIHRIQSFCLKSLTLCLYDHFTSMVAHLLLQPHILTVLSFIVQKRTIIKTDSKLSTDRLSATWTL